MIHPGTSSQFRGFNFQKAGFIISLENKISPNILRNFCVDLVRYWCMQDELCNTFVAPNWIWYCVLTSMEFVGCCRYCYNNNITIIIITAAAQPTTSSCWHCNLQGTYGCYHDKILQQCCRTFLSFRGHLFLCNSHMFFSFMLRLCY